MKILMLTPYLPYPLLSGGQIRTYNLLKNLKDKHEVHLYSLIKDEEEEKNIPELKKFCKTVNVFKRSKHPFTLRNILLAGFSPYPFLVIRNLPLQAKAVLTEVLEKGKFDLIHAETFYVMPNLPQTNVPILLVEQTIEYLVYQDFVDHSQFIPLKPLLRYDVAKIMKWERFYWKKADHLATMSQEDKDFILRFTPKKPIDVVANGVDQQYFQGVVQKNPTQPVVLFVGQFKWLPNRDAVEFIYREIWPIIKKQLPNCKLRIVGRHPSEEIRRLNNHQDVMVDEGVEDIRNAYGSASVLLAPIRSGRGTKYKILEAMASGLPVVATKLGIEGIDATDEKDVLVADSAEDLAKKTIEVLKDQEKSKRIAKSARKLIFAQYNWEMISAKLDGIYKQLGKT